MRIDISFLYNQPSLQQPTPQHPNTPSTIQSTTRLITLMHMLGYPFNHTLLPNLHSSAFQILRIPSIIRSLIMESHQVRSIREQVVHFLKWEMLSLG